MKQYTVAVLGATGAVGQEMIKILQERNFPVGKLKPLASARSAGKTLRFKGEDVVIEEARDEAFQGVDIVLGAAENDIAKKFAPAIVKAGAVFVDNSSAFRLDPNVPDRPGNQPRGREEPPWHYLQSQLLHHHHRYGGERSECPVPHPHHDRLYLSGGVRRRCRRPH